MMNENYYIKFMLPDGSKAVMDAAYEVTEEPTEENTYPYVLHMDDYPSYSKYVCFGPSPDMMTPEKKWEIVQRVAEEYDQYLYTLYHNIERNYLSNHPDAEAFPYGWRTFIELVPFFDMRDDVWEAHHMESAIFEGNTPSAKAAIIINADCDVF